MKQCTAILKDRDAFFEWLEKAKDSAEYKNSKEVLIKVMTTLLPEADSRNLHSTLKEYFPKAKIIGLSMMPRSQKIIGIAEQVRAPMEKGEAYAIISIFYFDSSDVTIFDIDSSNINSIQEMAFTLKRRLKKIPNLKGVEILSAGLHPYLADFLEMLTDGLEDVPFFGAMAGMEVKEKITCEYHNILNALQGIETTQFVIGKDYHLDGIVLAAYSGEDLHIDAHYDFGWKPVGKELKATKTLGISGLSTIDDEPAVSIYKKYLNIEPNDYLMFNVFEFPLLVDRGGVPASRVPLVYDEFGRLYFPSDIHQGETIRLSYGNPAELLKETEETGRNLKFFDPQAISIYICSVRMVFLADDAKKEIEIFRDILPDTAYCLANGEIFKYKGQGGALGLALISIAFREGPPQNICDNTEPVVKKKATDSEIVVPLTKRLAAFLEATTNELNASNENLKDAVIAAEAASKSKSQFLSNMSHEIRTPINAILGMNEMILRESTDETILEYAENIRSAGNSLLGIVNDILDFSKIEAGKMDI
ncbi:MAG: FIST C-terminal domain-containing protein, partial [Selenomonadaceae bacterium]|nr:FIST C-terminal domain-containing protein [Selenomonadaceae bacterium]